MNTELYKERLLAEQAEIELELNHLGHKVPGQDDWIARPDAGDGEHADPVDNADITEDYEEKLAILKVLEERHAQVKKALAAIEAGTYGICELSGKPISQERLEANPSATTCIEYA